MDSRQAPSPWRRARVIATVAALAGLLAAVWAGATGHLPMAALLAAAAVALLPSSLLGRRARHRSA